MQKWEHCVLGYEDSGGLKRVLYFMGTEEGNRFSKRVLPQKARGGIAPDLLLIDGNVIGDLGTQGWELTAITNDNWYWFKRSVSISTA